MKYDFVLLHFRLEFLFSRRDVSQKLFIFGIRAFYHGIESGEQDSEGVEGWESKEPEWMDKKRVRE